MCPTRYRTRHFFNNFSTNENIAGGPLLRVATIRRTTDTHYRHIPLHFSHNERTPVQISLQYLHAGLGSEWDTLYIRQQVFVQTVRYCCPILFKSESIQQISVKFHNTKRMISVPSFLNGFIRTDRRAS